MPRLAAFLALACSLGLAACQPAARASAEQAPAQAPAQAHDEAVPPAATPPAPLPRAGQQAQAPAPEEAPQTWPTSLVLGIGERVPLAGGSLTLQRIVADSRCPKDAQCIWAGEVTLAFEYRPPTGAPRGFELSQRGNPRASLGEHDIALTGFGPCPAGHSPASPAGCATVAFPASEMR